MKSMFKVSDKKYLHLKTKWEKRKYIYWVVANKKMFIPYKTFKHDFIYIFFIHLGSSAQLIH